MGANYSCLIWQVISACLTSSRRRQGRSLWAPCSNLGLSWKSGAGLMKLISWNIQWCRGCDGRVDPARISKVARDMADFDVLCLQEVARNYPDLAGSSGENQYETLAGLFPDYTVVKGVAVDVLAPGGDRREFGNAIITRL